MKEVTRFERRQQSLLNRKALLSQSNYSVISKFTEYKIMVFTLQLCFHIVQRDNKEKYLRNNIFKSTTNMNASKKDLLHLSQYS